MNRTLVCSLVLLCGAATSRACSVCIAHAIGAALHGIGSQTLMRGTKVLSIGFIGFDKTNAAEGGGSLEHEHYRQLSLDALYGLTDETTLTASVPYVLKSIDGARTMGVGDASIGFIHQLKPSEKSKFLLAFNGSVKIPTGPNNLRDSGGTVRDEHEQLGTGSTDLSLGVSATAEGPKHSLIFAEISGRWNGTNSRHFHYGNAVFYDLGFSHPLEGSSAVVFEINGRVAGRDRSSDGTLDDESGGHLMYFSVSYRRGIGKDLGLIATVQQPILQRLNGSQHEGSVISVSLSRMF
jgi:hypothetical protein